MLSDRLKRKDLFSDNMVDHEELREDAKKVLRHATDSLILAMRVIEESGVMCAEEIEELVIEDIEKSEQKYYIFGKDFDEYVMDFISKE